MSITGAIRTVLVTLKQHLSDKIKEADNLIKSEDQTQNYYEDLREIKTNLLSISNRVQTKCDEWINLLQDMADKEDLEQEQVHYDSVCDEYTSLVLAAEDMNVALDRRLRKLDHHLKTYPESQTSSPIRTSPTHDMAGPSNRAESTGGSRSYSIIKVPKFTLPRFDGNYMEWKEFWGIFESNIHKRPDLTNIERFTYLRGQLDGVAKQAISGVIISDDTYDAAVAALKQRFDRADDRLISLLYSQLKQVPPSGTTTQDQQATLDACNSIFRQLEAAGEAINANRSLNIDLLSKFPATTVRDLQRYYHVGPNSKLQDVRDGLDKSIQEMETLDGVIDDLHGLQTKMEAKQQQKKQSKCDSTPHPHPEYARISHSRRNGPESSSNTTTINPGAPPFIPHSQNPTLTTMEKLQNPESNQQISPPSRCYFCDDEHFNSDCLNYSSAPMRARRLLETNRCSRCMQKGHESSHCRKSIQCRFCKSQHHSGALCFQTFPDAWFPSNTEPATFSEPPTQPISNNNVNTLTKERGSTLFPTAKTTVQNPSTGETAQLRLSMDTMSSRSYITEAAAQKLGLSGGEEDKLQVSVFGSNQTHELPTREVSFHVLFTDGTTYEVQANTTKLICDSNVFPENWSADEQKVLSQFKQSLADDPYDPNGNIDILIGADIVWKFMHRLQIMTDAPDLYLISSKFGLMLAGKSSPKPPRSSVPQPTLLCMTNSGSRLSVQVDKLQTNINSQSDDGDSIQRNLELEPEARVSNKAHSRDLDLKTLYWWCLPSSVQLIKFMSFLLVLFFTFILISCPQHIRQPNIAPGGRLSHLTTNSVQSSIQPRATYYHMTSDNQYRARAQPASGYSTAYGSEGWVSDDRQRVDKRQATEVNRPAGGRWDTDQTPASHAQLTSVHPPPVGLMPATDVPPPAGERGARESAKVQRRAVERQATDASPPVTQRQATDVRKGVSVSALWSRICTHFYHSSFSMYQSHNLFVAFY